MQQPLLVIGLACTLTACGGSSGGSSPTPTPVEPDSIVAYDDNAQIGQAIDLFLFAPSQNVSDIQWQQTSGAPVTFLADNSKGIAFTPESSGQYGFQVSYQTNGTTQTLSHTVSVAEEEARISARLGHAVLEGNKVSLRAFLDETVETSSLSWQQVAGPSVTFTDSDTQGDLAVFFDAPAVAADTLLEFNVSAEADGTQYTDRVAVLVENATDIGNSAYFEDRVARVFPYNSDSPYADTLVSCVYSNSLTSSCKLSSLPLIASDTITPGIEDIMDRVVVSHKWMGDRFKEFLQTQDSNNDFKNLLRATTAVVIAYDVRPSFYWVATGAIYLDADNFWLTPEERDTINEAPDYRSAFGNDLQFVMPWRYVKDNDYVNVYHAASARVTRSTEDGLFRLISLMYHELAHANDFFPSSEWFSHNSNDRILDAAQTTNFESDKLAIAYPLRSQEMVNLAQVSFHGEAASSTQKAYSPSDVSQFFSPDDATDYYNYSSKREDYAMLFDELMMYARYDINRDVAVTNRPTGDNVSATDYIVDWGQRGRIGEPRIKPRIAYVLERVLPEFNATSVIENLPAPIAMIPGNNWLENLAISPVPHTLSAQLVKISAPHAKTFLPVNVTRYYNKALPKH